MSDEVQDIWRLPPEQPAREREAARAAVALTKKRLQQARAAAAKALERRDDNVWDSQDERLDKEFDAAHRASDWNAWLTFAISPAAPGEAPTRPPLIRK